jgi:hypothetical protein
MWPAGTLTCSTGAGPGTVTGMAQPVSHSAANRALRVPLFTGAGPYRRRLESAVYQRGEADVPVAGSALFEGSTRAIGDARYRPGFRLEPCNNVYAHEARAGCEASARRYIKSAPGRDKLSR